MPKYWHDLLNETNTEFVRSDGQVLDEVSHEAQDEVPIIVAVVVGVGVPDGPRGIDDKDKVSTALRTYRTWNQYDVMTSFPH